MEKMSGTSGLVDGWHNAFCDKQSKHANALHPMTIDSATMTDLHRRNGPDCTLCNDLV
jgi:hypothetical protein